MNLSKASFQEICNPCLIIESFYSGHYEVAADLALQLRRKGIEVYFCFISNNIPLGDYHIRFLPKRYLRMREIKKINNILKSKSVDFINTPNLSESQINNCVNFSKKNLIIFMNLKNILTKALH